MREAKQQFVSEHGPDLDPTPERPCRPPIHWVPTEAISSFQEAARPVQIFIDFDSSVNAQHLSCLWSLMRNSNL